MKRSSLSICCATALAIVGCGPATSPTGEQCPEWNDNVDPASAPTTPPSGSTNTSPPTRTVDLAACTAGMTQDTIDRHLQLADRIEKNFGEQRACGLLLRNYSFSLSHWFASAACGYVTRPSGFTYNGSGYYLVGGIMGVQAKLAKDTSFGKKGDDILFDVFDQGSYGNGPMNIKAEIIADTTWTTNDPLDVSVRLKGSLTITQEEPKVEGLELWGIPADGKSTEKQQEELAKTIGESVMFTVEANVAPVEVGDVSYTFNVAETTVDATYNSKSIPLTLTNISAVDTETQQNASSVYYGVTFIPYPHGPLDGSMIFKVEGGSFTYFVKYTYPNRVEPDVAFSCTQPTP